MSFRSAFAVTRSLAKAKARYPGDRFLPGLDKLLVDLVTDTRLERFEPVQEMVGGVAELAVRQADHRIQRDAQAVEAQPGAHELGLEGGELF